MAKVQICPKDCEKRSIGCHASCAHYVAHSIFNGEVNMARRSAGEYTEYRTNVIHKSKKRNGVYRQYK